MHHVDGVDVYLPEVQGGLAVEHEASFEAGDGRWEVEVG